jgi:hypothetical protein
MVRPDWCSGQIQNCGCERVQSAGRIAALAYPSLTYFNKVDTGGHFAAWEAPERLTTEIHAAFRSLRKVMVTVKSAKQNHQPWSGGMQLPTRPGSQALGVQPNRQP